MDIAASFSNSPSAIKCIDMHTTGEPTRIIYSGFPHLDGETLLDKRDQAQKHHDHIRKRVMLEPRGHNDMYGAILIQETELVRNGDAHIGVLFTHAGGFSTMCGHATIALGRFLVDTNDLNVFPKRDELVVDQEKKEVEVKIHAPCGVVTANVPVVVGQDGSVKSDETRGVSFLSSPGYAVTGLEVDIPDEIRWSELGSKKTIALDISYGGAFYALVDAREMGFAEGLNSGELKMKALAAAAKKLKGYLSTHPTVVEALKLAEDERLSFLYSVMVVDSQIGYRPDGVDGAETGVCFFGDRDQIDRSPTGSCVTARIALAHAQGAREPGQKWAYNSLVSNKFQKDAFVGAIADDDVSVTGDNGISWSAIIARVEGNAYYTGAVTFVQELGDVTSEEGFTIDF
ncbi:hypothetical protein BJY04DRAFT_186383 [Aspergillus karnatakaensis]|uniref:putative proline racemase n=1 Tax=Aspergillus karnatakaensis TaxID=1810916 RepID=UPI003CCCD145